MYKFFATACVIFVRKFIISNKYIAIVSNKILLVISIFDDVGPLWGGDARGAANAANAAAMETQPQGNHASEGGGGV